MYSSHFMLRLVLYRLNFIMLLEYVIDVTHVQVSVAICNFYNLEKFAYGGRRGVQPMQSIFSSKLA